MSKQNTCPDCGTLDLARHSFEECCANLVTQLDNVIAERDALQNNWSGLLIEQARLTALRDDAIAERDALRAVYDAAAVYCGHRTTMHEHALIDAVGDAKAMGLQP